MTLEDHHQNRRKASSKSSSNLSESGKDPGDEVGENVKLIASADLKHLQIASTDLFF